ncbi:MAG TPA: AI-2E family transporter [Pelomicrobium sp.]|nr:AI-2E family transporter [Pelomicrobium sp.]
MATIPTLSESDRNFLNLTVEAALRIGLLAFLTIWCFNIARPFLVPILWGVIIAVAVYPGYRRVETWLSGRRGLAAALVTLLMLVALAVPSVLLGESMVKGVHNLSSAFQAGTLHIPAPPDRVAEWPLVGEQFHAFWKLAAEDVRQAAQEAGPFLKTVGRWLVGFAAGAGLGLLQFVIAIVIAGVLLAHAEGGARATRSIAERLSPAHGLGFADTAEKIVRSVASGILGVALLQGLLAGIGFLVAGVPAAGLLTIICIVLGVIQVGVVIVLIPVVIWLFSTADTVTAVAFLIYAILIAPVDNILKPLLLGRGAKLPMVVVFIGAIGGFIEYGIIGLFVGAVVFTLGYGLLLAWLYPERRPPAPPQPAGG